MGQEDATLHKPTNDEVEEVVIFCWGLGPFSTVDGPLIVFKVFLQLDDCVKTHLITTKWRKTGRNDLRSHGQNKTFVYYLWLYGSRTCFRYVTTFRTLK